MRLSGQPVDQLFVADDGEQARPGRGEHQRAIVVPGAAAQADTLTVHGQRGHQDQLGRAHGGGTQAFSARLEDAAQPAGREIGLAGVLRPVQRTGAGAITGSRTRAPPAASASTSAVVPGSVPNGRYAHTVVAVTFDTALTSADAS